MKKFFVILFVLVLVTPLPTQESTGRIIGKVVDTDGNPIPGVTVTLLASSGAPMEVFTTAEGEFRFVALPPMTGYALKAELEGFKTLTKIGITVAAGETTELNLKIEMADLGENEPIVVISSLPPRGLHKNMQLTKEQIEAFRSAKTVRIFVEQSYQDNRDKDLKNVRLPLEYVAGKVLRFIGLQVIGPGVESYDLEIKIITEGTANVWYGKISPPKAKITNNISFKLANVPLYAATIYNYAGRDRPQETNSEPIKARRNPFSVDELAYELMRSFEGDIIELMAEIFGISPLLARLDDKNVSVRKYAARALSHVKDQRSVEPLLACMNDEDTNVRAIAVKSLASIDDPRIFGILIEALKQDDEIVRAAVVESLVYLDDERTVKPLIAALKDEAKDVRVAAAKSLDHLENREVVEPLISSLKDKDEAVRAAAASSLEYIGDSRAAEPLKGALKDRDKDVRAAALGALIRLVDDPEEDDILKEALKDNEGIVRASALKSMWQLDDDQLALEYLLGALTDKSEIVRAAAIGSLYDYCDEPGVVEALISALKDKNAIVRAATARSIGFIEDPRAVEPLIDCLSDKEEVVQAAVLDAFRYSDDPRVVEALINTLKDKDENFRMYVDEVLETITSNSFDGNQKKWKKWWKENREEFIKKRQI